MEVKLRVLGGLNVALALSITAVWYYILSVDLFPKLYTTPVEIGMHLLAELVTVLLLLVTGIGLLRTKRIGNWYSYALGMTGYTAIHSSGYLFQRSLIEDGILILGLWLLSITALIVYSNAIKKTRLDPEQ